MQPLFISKISSCDSPAAPPAQRPWRSANGIQRTGWWGAYLRVELLLDEGVVDADLAKLRGRNEHALSRGLRAWPGVPELGGQGAHLVLDDGNLLAVLGGQDVVQ